MRIEPITGKDKLGRTVVFRAAMPEDAGSRKRTGQVSVKLYGALIAALRVLL